MNIKSSELSKQLIKCKYLKDIYKKYKNSKVFNSSQKENAMKLISCQNYIIESLKDMILVMDRETNDN